MKNARSYHFFIYIRRLSCRGCISKFRRNNLLVSGKIYNFAGMKRTGLKNANVTNGKSIRMLLLFVLMLPLAMSAQNSTDSLGVYAVTDSQVRKMEIIAFEDVKTDNVLASTFTLGFVGLKGRYVFEGKTSPHHFQKRAHFRMFFRQPQKVTNAEDIMFDAQYTVRDFHIGKFKQKKENRLLTGITATIIKTDETVNFEKKMTVWYREIRPGVYDVFVDGKPGEYCFVFTGIEGNWGGYVYDFTIE